MSPLVTLFLTVFVDLVGFGLVIPLLPFYAEHFRATPDVVALLMAAFSFMQFLFAPVWGRASDRLGRKPVLVMSLTGAVASYVWLAFAGSLWQLFAARGLAGAMAGNIAAAQAYIADVTPPERRARGMGIIGAAFGLGFIVGPAIGGVLAGPDPADPNVQAPAFASAGLSLFALLFAVVFLRESLEPAARAAAASRPHEGRVRLLADALRRPGLGLLILVFFLVTFVFAGMEATFAMWSERQFGWGAQQNGYVFAYAGLLAAAVQGGLIGPLSQRFGEARLLVSGSLALGLGLTLITLAVSVPLLIAAITLLALGLGVSTPSLNSLISQHAATGARGGTLGVSQSAASLARIVGPAFAGFCFATFGRDWPYIAGAVVMAAVLVLALRVTPPRASSAAPGS